MGATGYPRISMNQDPFLGAHLQLQRSLLQAQRGLLHHCSWSSCPLGLMRMWSVVHDGIMILWLNNNICMHIWHHLTTWLKHWTVGYQRPPRRILVMSTEPLVTKRGKMDIDLLVHHLYMYILELLLNKQYKHINYINHWNTNLMVNKTYVFGAQPIKQLLICSFFLVGKWPSAMLMHAHH